MPKKFQPRVVSEATCADTHAKAVKAGCRFYIGDACQDDGRHGNVRYTANKQCVECERGKFRVRAAKERAKRSVHDMAKRSPVAYSFVAFTLGSVEGIKRWLASMERKGELR